MRKQTHYVTLLLLFFCTNPILSENHVDLYINTYKDIAVREMMRSGIPASITLAQGIHESAWGRGELAVNSNNHFGIKCKSYWKGASFYFKDDDYDKNGNLIKSCFRAYKNPEMSYIDHTDFLMSTAHYQELFNYSSTDYKRWAKGLKKCGYATDKEYANKLIRTIEKYQLHKYDYPGVQNALVSAPSYRIPKKQINELLIPSEKKESTEYSVLEVPAAVPIPDDYERQPKKTETVEIVNQELPRNIVYEAVDVEENIPKKNEIIPERRKQTENKIQINQPTYVNATEPVKTNSYAGSNPKKESIIPSAFASTKRTYHLTRKPRSKNSEIR